MKVTCDGLDLSVATGQVIKAISNKTTNPVLEGIKIEAVGDTLTLSSTDLELAIIKTIRAQVKEEGVTVIPGKFFSDFLRRLTSEKIDLELVDNKKMKISYTDSESFIQCFSPLEFPNLDTVDEEDYFVISKKDFKSLISKTIFSTALDDTRPVLKGVCLEIKENTITAVGLDGYRLALVNKPLMKSTKQTSIIVPSKSLTEIVKFLDDSEEEIKVCLQRNFLMVEVDSTKIISRLIDGEYINYKQIIPKEFTTSIVIDKNIFEEAIDRTSVLSRTDRNNLVKLDIKERLMTLTSNSDIGNIKENIGVSLRGNDILIAFNARYFAEALRTISDEVVKISFNMPASPCVITPSEGEEFLFLILPVRIINQ